MYEPWWLLLVLIAAAVGWMAGRRGAERKGGVRASMLSTTYFRGLNYLLSEQQDKAIEVFLQIAAVDKDTVETQFALGLLFRRRGEVDRAIRMHQSLIDRPGLSHEQKARAALALGEDYLRAGLYDRAEVLFTDMARKPSVAAPALRHLLAIAQAERDWPRAIEHAQAYELATKEPMGRQITQFHCELADHARLKSDTITARAHIASAYVADSQSIRAGLIEGRLELAEGNDAAAIRAFERVARNDVEFLPEFLDDLLQCYQRRNEPARARGFLLEMVEGFSGISPVLALTRILEAEAGAQAAMEFLSQQLQQRPSIAGESALIDLCLSQPDGDPIVTLHKLRHVNEQLIARNPGYRCRRCGFGARVHHWQCPSCKSWGAIKPGTGNQPA